MSTIPIDKHTATDFIKSNPFFEHNKHISKVPQTEIIAIIAEKKYPPNHTIKPKIGNPINVVTKRNLIFSSII